MGISKWRVIGLFVAVASTAVLLAVSVGIAAGQGNPWVRLFGSPFPDEAMAVSVDHLGNIYITGRTGGRLMDQTRSGGDSDAYVFKFDPSGNPVWARQFGTVGTDTAWSVAVSRGGDIFVAGQTAQPPPNRAYILGFSIAFLRKFSGDGTELWARQFGTPGGVLATGVTVDSTGNSYVVGQTEEALPGQTSFGRKDAFIRSYDAGGNERWTRQFGGDGGDFAAAVASDGSGNTFVAGSIGGEIERRGRGTQMTISPFVHKFGPDGTSLWERRFDMFGFAEFSGAAVDSLGSIYLTGWVSGSAPGQTQAGGTDAFVTKMDGDGRDVWTQQFGTNLEDRALGITVDEGGNSYSVGWTRGQFPNQTDLGERTLLERKDAFIHKIDFQGNALWTRQFGTPSPQHANAVTAVGDGSLFIVGNTTGTLLGQTALGTVDGFLMKQEVGPPGDPLEALPTARPASAVSTVPPTPLDPARLTPGTPVTPPTVTPIDRAPNTSACSAPLVTGGPIPIGWILLTMIPASLAASGWRKRRWCKGSLL